ncbi:TPA: Glu-tRNA(Gln) amidotransferase subunit GatD [Candidatus Woesearchaeota archaeon]|nr:Glu-tRNA(Gln) amidotransferase subunit GatD [Candidatus Woesearchaeota archaeon]
METTEEKSRSAASQLKNISCTYNGQQLKGVLLQEQDGQVSIKLESGYNAIVPRDALKNIVETPLPPKEAPQQARTKQRSDLPMVTILHTGGTIASKVDYATGAVLAQFEPGDLLAMYPEITAIANIESKFLRNMWSDDMRFAHYNIMARAVLDEIIRDTRGVIITHGTDTMHYTAAALAFALEGLNIPVVLVGSQRSSDRGSSDAGANLIGALTFITTTKTPGVFIAMHEETSDGSTIILDGLHCRKNHSSRRDAFVPVNGRAVARVKDGKVEVLDADSVARNKAAASARPAVISFKEDLKVGVWKAHPQSYVDELIAFEEFDGLIIEGTGLGHAPISQMDDATAEHNLIRERIEYLARKMPVAMTTQTIHGRVNMDVYSPGRTLQGFSVLGQGCDMPMEVAIIKLAWLLSHKTLAETRSLYGTDLRGEISVKGILDGTHKEP